MRFGVENKIFIILLLVIFCLISNSCGQTKDDARKITLEYEKEVSIAQKNGDLESAIEKQSEVVGLNPENAKKKAVLASLYIEKYDKDGNNENLNKAKELLEKAIKIEPNNSLIRNALVIVLEKEGNDKEILEENKKIVDLDPNNLQNLTNLGIAYINNNDKESARRIFENVLEKNPHFTYGLYHYGVFELEQGNTGKAKELFEKAVKSSSQTDNVDSEYVELSRKRLDELNSQKAKTAKAPN